MGFTLPCSYYRIGFFTSSFRLPQVKAHATPKIPTTPAAAAVAAGPYLGCDGSHAEDIGVGPWLLCW